MQSLKQGFQRSAKWPFSSVLFAVSLKCFIKIFICKVRKYAGQNILAIKKGLLVPHILHQILPVFCQTIYWWKTSQPVFDESPHCASASSRITCAEVVVAPVVTPCADLSFALLWGCTVVLSDPVCSALEFWSVLCLWGPLLSADCMCVCVWVHGAIAHVLPCCAVGVHDFSSLCSLCSWGGILNRVWLFFFLLLPLNLNIFFALRFRFLFENQTPAHVYYRWKLYSILQASRIFVINHSFEHSEVK